jgi:hypothetical protein
MSFRCAKCDKAQEPKTTPNKVVVAWHERRDSDGTILRKDIAREIDVCDECYDGDPNAEVMRMIK